jgi:Leucine-rich repeat (LRR) protein
MKFDSDIEEPEKVANVKIDFSSFGQIINGIDKNFPKLEKLTIHGIKFVSIKNLSELKELNIHGNKDLKIYRRAFEHLKNLEHLDLSDCHIKTLPEDCFNFQHKLKRLDLAGNMLTELRWDL